MTLFLTSHPGGYRRIGEIRVPAPLNAANGFVDALKARWPDSCRVLIIAADPEDFRKKDDIFYALSRAFPMSGLSILECRLCDSRSRFLIERISDYEVIILSGGHVPTQNAFFHSLKLGDRLTAFSGIIIGISAGTVNCAETVYAHPELEGEASDPGYRRFIPGLGVTSYQTLPHYQAIKEDTLDGLRLFEDIAYPDSVGNTFYALCDGSYILQEPGCAMLYGEAYLIRNASLKKICCNGEYVVLP